MDQSKGSYGSQVYVNIAFDGDESIGIQDYNEKNNNNRNSVILRSKTLKKIELNGTALVWKNISYDVKQRFFDTSAGFPYIRERQKQILHPQNGYISSGQLMAIIGPSGAGKSTLLSCLTGRNVDNVKGSISVVTNGNYTTSKKKQISIAFVPQRDNLFTAFTVRETLLFASKMKNHDKKFDHKYKCDQVMEQLNLTTCADVKVSNCSGGQVKRLCIAEELLSNPDILVLDEPTTGLDSLMALQCIQVLKSLADKTENPPAIIATIHQPNYEIFSLFTSLYVLSRSGQNIYFGPPLEIVNHFRRFNVPFLEQNNPAEVAIRVASKEYGGKVMGMMSKDQFDKNSFTIGKEMKTLEMRKIREKSEKVKKPLLYHTIMVTIRNWKQLTRRPLELSNRAAVAILISLSLAFMYNYPIGEEDGCLTKSPINATNLTAGRDEYIEKMGRIVDCYMIVMMVILTVMMQSMISGVLFAPKEAVIILKEIHNNWYKTSAYFTSKLIVDVPLNILTILIVTGIIYPLTSQIPVWWRFASYVGILYVTAELVHSLSMVVGTVTGDDMVSGVMLTFALSFPAFLFSGAIVRYENLPVAFKFAADTSFMRYAFESILLVMYGFGRCQPSLGKNFIEKFKTVTDPISIFKSFMETVKFTQRDLKRYAALINVDEESLGSVYNGTLEYLGINDGSVVDKNSTSPQIIPSIDDDFRDSYVLTFFNIKNSMIVRNIAILFAYLVILKCLQYVIFSYRSRKRW